MIVVDTNVVSELMKPAPNETVSRWAAGRPSSSLYISTITQAEILLGIGLLPKGMRRSNLQSAAETMFEAVFAGRILPFDEDAARALPGIAVQRRRLGRPISQCDAQIAAIARCPRRPNRYPGYSRFRAVRSHGHRPLGWRLRRISHLIHRFDIDLSAQTAHS